MDGTFDSGFNPGAGANGEVLVTAIDSTGKVLIGGDFTQVDGTSRPRIARLNADGTLDTTFTPGTGANGAVRAIHIDGGGNIFIGGDFTTYNSAQRLRIAKLSSTGARDDTWDPGSRFPRANPRSGCGWT